MKNSSNCNYIGQTYNYLTVKNTYTLNGRLIFTCQCKCGTVKDVRADSVLSGKSMSCGCLNHKPHRFKNLSREDYKKIFDAWKRINYRCYNPNHHKFNSYGGRGISVCDEWRENPNAFIEWSLASNYSKDLTLDRIDVNGNYEPTNCRWATKSQQQRNRRNTVFVTYNNEHIPLADFCDRFNLPYDATKERIKNGWSLDKCICTPIVHKKHKPT